MAWRAVFFMFGLMGFLWSFMWIVTYRDFNLSLVSVGDEEAFIHPSSKVIRRPVPLLTAIIDHFSLGGKQELSLDRVHLPLAAVGDLHCSFRHELVFVHCDGLVALVSNENV